MSSICIWVAIVVCDFSVGAWIAWRFNLFDWHPNTEPKSLVSIVCGIFCVFLSMFWATRGHQPSTLWIFLIVSIYPMILGILGLRKERITVVGIPEPKMTFRPSPSMSFTRLSFQVADLAQRWINHPNFFARRTQSPWWFRVLMFILFSSPFFSALYSIAGS